MTHHQLWQTWELVRPVAPRPSAAQNTPRIARSDDFRKDVQKARIERRWSVSMLASECDCDVETLAAFERGDEVIAPSIQARLKAVLKIFH